MTEHDSAEHKPAEPAGPPSNLPVIAGIVLFVAFWGAVMGYRAATGGPMQKPASDPHAVAPTGEAAHDDHAPKGVHPAYWSVLPFVLLLGAIAIFPLWGATYHWWESNQSKLIVAGGLALVTLIYYMALYPPAGPTKTLEHLVFHTLLGEYLPFIILLFSLFTIAGGIRISGDLAATPTNNSIFMLVGAVLASFIGTTGAAMVLIRPLLETNSQRKNVAHTVVFFIFIVCNVGGSLLPIGDPPLFLGYLQGVPFLWTFFKLWAPWLITNALLIAIYYCWDAFVSYPAESEADLAKDKSRAGRLSYQGLLLNGLLLLGVVLAVALLDPSKPLVGTDWKPFPYLREVVMLGLVALSLVLGSAEVREQNGFNYNAILEVAALFIGIFITMRPALDILNIKGPDLPVESPLALFWASGSLSAVLDNAPTYLVFLNAADGQMASTGKTVIEWLSDTGPNGQLANAKLMGISLGSVFMGSMTYIGNGPNFMVKSIAEESGVPMPSFFGYVFMYSFPVLLPVFALISVLFLYVLK